MLKNLKIGWKLGCSFGLITIILILSMVVSLVNLSNVSKELDTIATVTNPVINDIWSMRRNIVSVERGLYKGIVTTDPVEVQQILETVEADAAEVKKMVQALPELYDGDPQDIEDLAAALEKADVEKAKVIKETSKCTPEGNAAAFATLTGEFTTHFNNVNAIALEMYEGIHESSTASISKADDDAQKAVFVLIALMIVSVIFAVVVSVVMTRGIRRPLGEVAAAVVAMADGNLRSNLSYQSKDEIGVVAENLRSSMGTLKSYIDDIANATGQMAIGNFNIDATQPFIGDFKAIEDSIGKMIIEMSTTLAQIYEAANQVSSGSEQVSSAAQTLAQGATEQASSVQELAASINDISGQVKLNAQHSNNASEMAGTATRAIAESNEQMQQLMTAMDNIQSRSAEIGKIIKTIEDIAFQTNILALNAAVEAARAGEAGKGFAVVADEVRNLAAKSADAAKNTTNLIESSIMSVNEGVDLAKITAEKLLVVVDDVQETTGVIQEITKANNDQAVALNQITIGLDQISAVVQTNSATSEESAAASEELFGQASLLKDLIGRFTLKEGFDTGVKNIGSYRATPQRQLPRTLDLGDENDKY